jgi:D-alanyl-D-alanine carboxypeptidase (penicillin-binding protein 5/6)
MRRFRVGRFLGILLGTLVILAVGLYGPATLLGPLPAAQVTLLTPTASTDELSPPVLPVFGTSGLVEFSENAEAGTTTLARAGSETALPMASAAKIVTALVVLDEKSMGVGESGPNVTLSTPDYQDYIDFSNANARTVVVFPDETWSERELLQAMILGSSNNHANTLARWAFGSVDEYVEAANSWLAAEGLTDTVVADATGLSDASAGTGADLARLAGLAAANPVIIEILSESASALADQRGVTNTTEYLPELGITGISRSYTDAAGVCFLFIGTVEDGESVYSFSGAFIGEPDYPSLDADLAALMTSAAAGVANLPLLRQGDSYALIETSWGQSANAVVRASETRYGWLAAEQPAALVDVYPLTTGREGRTIGRVTLNVAGDEVTSPLILDHTLSSPGAGWRLMNPVPLIGTFLASLRGATS